MNVLTNPQTPRIGSLLLGLIAIGAPVKADIEHAAVPKNGNPQ